jgi:hypothetical protein
MDSSNNIVDSDIIDLSRIIRMLNNSLHIENKEEEPPQSSESQLPDIINYRRHRAMLMNTMFNNISTLLNPNRNVISIDDYSSILNDSFQQDNSLYKNVISEQGNVELKTIIFSKEKFEYDTCPILHTQFEEGEEITQLPCSHVFDTIAINKWLQTEKAECPICRYKMKSKEIKIEQAHGVTGAHAHGVTGAQAHGVTGAHAHGVTGAHAHGVTGAHAHVTATGQIYTDTRSRFSGYYRQQQPENNSSEDIELQQAILNSIQQTRDL